MPWCEHYVQKSRTSIPCHMSTPCLGVHQGLILVSVLIGPDSPFHADTLASRLMPLALPRQRPNCGLCVQRTTLTPSPNLSMMKFRSSHTLVQKEKNAYIIKNSILLTQQKRTRKLNAPPHHLNSFTPQTDNPRTLYNPPTR